ncbi:hypothetical protein CCMA1212_001117, partial [Trichoderma ghanense]
ELLAISTFQGILPRQKLPTKFQSIKKEGGYPSRKRRRLSPLCIKNGPHRVTKLLDTARQSHTYRPRQQVLCTRYHNREDIKSSTYHPSPVLSPEQLAPIPSRSRSQLGLVSSSIRRPGARSNGKTRFVRKKGLQKTDLAAGRADARGWAKARRSAAVLLWRRVSACSFRKGDVRGLSPKAFSGVRCLFEKRHLRV